MTSPSPTNSPACPVRAYCTKSPDGLTRSVTGPPPGARPPPGGERPFTSPAGCANLSELGLTIWLTIRGRARSPITPSPVAGSPKGYSPVAFQAALRPRGRIPSRASLPSRAAGSARPGDRAALALQALGLAGLAVDSPGRRSRRRRAAGGLRRGRAGFPGLTERDPGRWRASQLGKICENPNKTA